MFMTMIIDMVVIRLLAMATEMVSTMLLSVIRKMEICNSGVFAADDQDG